MKPFKNKKEELSWEKDNCLTVKKLKDYLSKLPDDSLIYILEPNTHTWQSVSNPGYIFSNISEVKNNFRKSLNGWYRGASDKKQKVSRELRETFRYALDKDGICVYT